MLLDAEIATPVIAAAPPEEVEEPVAQASDEPEVPETEELAEVADTPAKELAPAPVEEQAAVAHEPEETSDPLVKMVEDARRT